jgi:DNA-directed RNA polymerase specialized sigma24 family protein
LISKEADIPAVTRQVLIALLQAAQLLGIPAATVKTRMFYARKKLAELVKDA